MAVTYYPQALQVLGENLASPLAMDFLQKWPDLTSRVAFMTGDTVGHGTQAFLDRVRRPCLQKPFKLGQLVAFVRAQLSTD